MILALDHITWCSKDFRTEQKKLLKEGYVLKFKEESVANLTIKKGLMKSWTPQQSLYFFHKPHCIPIEVVDHGSCAQDHSSISLDSSQHHCNNFVYYTRDAEKSTEFWTLFGWKIAGQEDGKRTLTFKSLSSPDTYTMILEERDDAHTPYLDYCGLHCPTFISTNVAREKEKYSSYWTSEIETFVVNGKTLQIMFVSGDHGELAEIISFKK